VNNRELEEGFGDDEAGQDADGPQRWDEGDPALETEGEVTCPYCGEVVVIALDAGGGATQDYVEDCQVCCRPWQVHVSFGPGGSVEVWVEATA